MPACRNVVCRTVASEEVCSTLGIDCAGLVQGMPSHLILDLCGSERAHSSYAAPAAISQSEKNYSLGGSIPFPSNKASPRPRCPVRQPALMWRACSVSTPLGAQVLASKRARVEPSASSLFGVLVFSPAGLPLTGSLPSALFWQHRRLQKLLQHGGRDASRCGAQRPPSGRAPEDAPGGGQPSRQHAGARACGACAGLGAAGACSRLRCAC